MISASYSVLQVRVDDGALPDLIGYPDIPISWYLMTSCYPALMISVIVNSAHDVRAVNDGDIIELRYCQSSS